MVMLYLKKIRSFNEPISIFLKYRFDIATWSDQKVKFTKVYDILIKSGYNNA